MPPIRSIKEIMENNKILFLSLVSTDDLFNETPGEVCAASYAGNIAAIIVPPTPAIAALNIIKGERETA
ncbi:MAG: hypothetical protein IPJ75_07505 [Ignavibacteriales bacterium]|nr:hypothetical protein [Ignavibacteriales bacterium]